MVAFFFFFFLFKETVLNVHFSLLYYKFYYDIRLDPWNFCGCIIVHFTVSCLVDLEQEEG